MTLEVKNLTFTYDKGENIFNNLNMICASGDIISILGKNGIGKTTFLKNLLYILEPTSGEILIDGKKISKSSIPDLYKLLAYVPQQNNIYKEYTVFDAILVGLSKYISAFNMPSEDDINLVNDILKEMNIERLKSKYLYEISGGELQLVLISRALISNPKILLLDEFETSLDISNQIYILELLKKKAIEKKIIIIYNTHYIDHALNYSDKVLILSKDSYIYGDSKDVINTENLHKAFNVKLEIITGKSGYKSICPII